MLPVVSVIGSCRVHNPISRLERSHLIKTNNHLISDFCHAPREALQKLRFANKRLNIPLHLHDYVFGRKNDDVDRADFSKSTMFIIEFSSVRRLCIDDIELQLNFVTDNLVKKNGAEEWLSSISKLTRHSAQDKKNKVEYSNTNIETANIIKNISMSLESNKVICDIMDRIVDYVRVPVVFVGHFNITKDDGTLVSDRNRLNSCMLAHARSKNYHFFDPTNIISMYGQDFALRDHNHWHANFESIVGHYLYQNYISIINKG